MRLRWRLIGALATCVAACFSCIVAAAAQSPAPSSESWALCTSGDARRVDQAIEACTAIIAASENNPGAATTAYGYRGIALFKRARNEQDREAAIRDLEKAVGAGLNTSMASIFRGYLHLARREIDLAIAEYDEAARRDPQNSLALAGRGGAVVQKGGAVAQKQDQDRPAANNDNTNRGDRANVIALVSRARAAIARADWSGAIAELDQALRLDSTSSVAAEAFTLRATARYQTSDFTGAIVDCEAALKINPRNEQALKIRSFAHVASGTASSNEGLGSMPDALMVYVAHGPAGACGEKCEEWLAVEGTVDWQGPRRVIAALDRLGTRKLPVVLNFRGRSGFEPSMTIGKILRGRGFDTTAGQTLVEDCRDPLQAECLALKRAGKPVKARLVPSKVCDIPCLLALAGGVRRTLPDSTAVIITGMFVPNRIGLEATAPFREGRHVRTRDLIKAHLTLMGVDPQLADMMERNFDRPRTIELSREDIARLRIVTAQ
jgi:tetratricopeptide (TPR) repeat protein